MKEYIKGANPYMPLWEHVPDGEPRVFEYNGETRVYVYGSHDTEKVSYCGTDYVVWSAPVTDLTDWTCHGVCYSAEDKSILFAPDVVKKDDTYYMYAAERKGSRIMVATSKCPYGPFTNPKLTDLGFDPGILVDDDGRVYAYWGFCKSFCAELNKDMATIKKGTLREHPLGHAMAPWIKEDDGHWDKKDAFFEASSPRKVMGKYVYIYSKRYEVPVPELGVFTDNNGFLSYKWSDTPLDDFKEGGDISFNGGEILHHPDGHHEMTYQWGNNHGSIMEVNGQWYIFYHRQTGENEFSRQAMLEPIDVAQDKTGKVYIGKVEYKKGEPVSSSPVEMTSQGAHVNGLDARKIISAGYACHIHGSKKHAFIAPVYIQSEEVSAPVMNITDGTTVGFRYLNFGKTSPTSVSVSVEAVQEFRIQLLADTYDGAEIAAATVAKGATSITFHMSKPLTGKHAIYFKFISKQEGVVANFDSFTFD